MPTSGIYAGKTTFASTIPLSLSLSLFLSLPRPLHSSRFSVSSTRTGTVSVYRSALSFPSLFFLPFPPAAYRSHSLDLFPSFPPFRSWHEVHEHAGSFFSVPLQALRGMHRSLATPTSVESSSTILTPFLEHLIQDTLNRKLDPIPRKQGKKKGGKEKQKRLPTSLFSIHRGTR